jgi:D-alanine-D-alanine ligase
MHEDLVPQDEPERSDAKQRQATRTESDVLRALEALGHDARPLGVRDELLPIRWTQDQWAPHIVFNLLEEFHGEAVYDHSVVSYLELLRLPYTGCNPRALVLARDKALAKKIVHYHRIRTPRFVVSRKGRSLRRPRGVGFPLIVKSLWEDASLGIARASVVTSEEKLQERVNWIHERLGTDAIVEEFVEGRELYVSVLGNERLEVLPPLELVVADPAPGAFVATARLKHDPAYQKKRGVRVSEARDLSDAARRALERASRRIYRALEFSGYGRIDFRLDAQGGLFFLEANPNPEIARDEELADAARCAGIDYERLVQKVLNLGLRRARRAPRTGG